MKSMKIQSASKPEPGIVPISDMERDNGPKYPYGLEICLSEDSLKALGISELPKVGAKMLIAGIVEVSSVSQFEEQGGKKDRSMRLQITDLELAEDKPKKPSKEILYDKEEEKQ